MSKATVETVMGQYESLTILMRENSNSEYSTEEVEDSTSFAEGVLGEEIAHFYPLRNSHVRGSGWTFYMGSEQSEFDYYIVSSTPSNWTAFGCNSPDFEPILQSFEENPFLVLQD